MHGRDYAAAKACTDFLRTYSGFHLCVFSRQVPDNPICCSIATGLWYQMCLWEFIGECPLTKLQHQIKTRHFGARGEGLNATCDHLSKGESAIFSLSPWDNTIEYSL